MSRSSPVSLSIAATSSPGWTCARDTNKKSERERNSWSRSSSRRSAWCALKTGDVRAAALPADRWLRIDVRDQRWAPYISSTWQQPGPPQLGKMPGFSDWDYKIWGIDVGLDPDSMDDDGLADYRYLTKRDEDEDEVEVEDGNDTKKRMQEDAFTDDEQT